MGNLGVWELIIIVVLVLVIFGGRKLPELGRGLGKGLANFRQAVREPDQPAASQPPPTQSADQSAPAEPSAEKPRDKADSPPPGDGS